MWRHIWPAWWTKIWTFSFKESRSSCWKYNGLICLKISAYKYVSLYNPLVYIKSNYRIIYNSHNLTIDISRPWTLDMQRVVGGRINWDFARKARNLKIRHITIPGKKAHKVKRPFSPKFTTRVLSDWAYLHVYGYIIQLIDSSDRCTLIGPVQCASHVAYIVAYTFSSNVENWVPETGCLSCWQRSPYVSLC